MSKVRRLAVTSGTGRTNRAVLTRAVVPYRCGTSALDVLAPGPISTAVVAVAVVDVDAIVVTTQRRRRRAAWY